MPRLLDYWDAFRRDVDGFGASIRRSKAVNVNADALRDEARTLVRTYFQLVRPGLVAAEVSEQTLQEADAQLQRLLTLANGRNAKSSYVQSVTGVRKLFPKIDLERISRTKVATGLVATTPAETAILKVLRKLLPSAALSYEQAFRDLQGHGRASWRGPALELREALRETLDHLAPDRDVMKSSGFKLEADQRGPTMAQKVRFVLRSRGLSSGELGAPSDAARGVDEIAGSLARSTYVRGSVATHVAGTRRQVVTLKRYVDTVLSELLELDY